MGKTTFPSRAKHSSPIRGEYRGIPPEPNRLPGLALTGSLRPPPIERLAERMDEAGYGFTSYERGWVYGQWYCGTPWKPSSYWGQFPATFVPRIMAMFPTERMLNVCSGHTYIKGAINLDIMPTPAVDIQADGAALPLADESFAVVLIDPPYSEEDSQRYGVKRLIKTVSALAEFRRVLVPGGYLLWFDERYPSYRRRDWHLCGLIGIVTGFERRARFVSIFRKTDDVVPLQIDPFTTAVHESSNVNGGS